MNLALLRFLCLVAFTPLAYGADWPCFRGPDRDGIARAEKGINKEWNQRAPKTLWKIALGDNGWAAPAVVNGKLYLVDHQGKEDVVRALDAATGKDLWSFAYPDAETNRYGFTVTTPLVLDNKVYTFSRKGKIHCLNATTGEKLWAHDVVSEYSAAIPPWGYTASPVVDGKMLLLGVSGSGAAMVALNKENGETLWKAGNYKMSYSSPVIATLHGRKQCLVYCGEGLRGIDLETGAELWLQPWPTPWGQKKCPTPIVIGDRVFIASAEGGETGVIDLSTGAPVVVWKHTEMQDHFTTPVFYHGRIYGSSDPKFLVCVNPDDGKILWKQESGQNTSVIGVDDTVLALSGQTGELLMVDVTTPDYKELGRFTPLGGTSWAAPIIADGRLYVRNQKELACIDLK